MNKAKKCLSGLVGWRNHYDTKEIAELSEELQVSETGEYYQERHPALRLDLIKATLPNNRDLGEYLQEVENGAVTEILNDLMESKELARTSKTVVANDVIYNTEGWVNDTILNESRFVGVRFRVMQTVGLKAVINRIALQLTQSQDKLPIYLYHSHRAKYLAKIEYTTAQGGQFNWLEVIQELHADDEDLSGGSFFLGYYQDDLTGQAIQYKKLNWRNGYCSTCDGGIRQSRYTSITKYLQMQPFYVPNGSLAGDNDFMFDPSAIIETDDNNWGFNFNVSINCDLTNFWCDNRKSLKNILALRVTIKILKNMQFSQQINHIEEQLKMMIIRDLEGDKETNYVNLYQQYSRAVKSLKFNHSSISKVCLPCDRNSGVSYGVV
jgi:hypothetical protein